MIKKIKDIIRENRENQRLIIKQNNELEWANIYHDSIRGKSFIENLPINIGRWAGSYPFFYLLNRIMNDAKPKKILEFGLGESSKFVSAYIENEIIEAKHTIIEQSQEWSNAFQTRFKLSNSSKITICPLVKKNINGFEVNCYEGLDQTISGTFDLYIIDGPFGSHHFSRYDIVTMADRLSQNQEFIIVLDDFDRIGEQETASELIQLFKEKQIKVYTRVFTGVKKVWLLTTSDYHYLTSI